jgi:flagellar basal body-associated protein FliL
MGQQQLLLIILGVIIVGIAIAVGISMFASGSIQSNKDAIVNDLNNLAANAYQYRIRPTTMGGGGGNSYVGYQVPVKLASNENADYTAIVNAPDIEFTGASKLYSGSSVVAVLDTAGRLGSFTYTGDFQ